MSCAVILFGVPLAADRLAPLVPDAFERRLSEVADSQIKVLFDAKVCDNPAGQKAFVKLMAAIRESAGMDTSVQSGVLSSAVPNAFALPGGKVYMFKGLLAKAGNADEIAGVLAHVGNQHFVGSKGNAFFKFPTQHGESVFTGAWKFVEMLNKDADHWIGKQ